MATLRDYYEILGVQRSRARRNQGPSARCLEVSSDRNPATRRRREIQERRGYEVLSDPDKRQRYDRFGHEGLRGGGVARLPAMPATSLDVEDIFENMGGLAAGSSGGPWPGGAATTLESSVADHLGRGRPRRRASDRVHPSGPLPHLFGQWRQAGNLAGHLPHLRRTRTGGARRLAAYSR